MKDRASVIHVTDTDNIGDWVVYDQIEASLPESVSVNLRCYPRRHFGVYLVSILIGDQRELREWIDLMESC